MKNKFLNIIKAICITLGFLILDSFIVSYLEYKGLNSMLSMVIAAIFLSVILIIIFYKELKRSFKEMHGKWLKNFIKYLKYFFVAYFIQIFLNMIIFMIVGSDSSNDSTVQQLLLTYPITSIIDTCILAPFYEEIIWRLNFKNLFKNKYVFAITTGIIFGSMHLLSASSPLELLYIFPYSTMGIMLGLVFYDENNIFNSMMLHAFNNTVAVALVFIGNTL